MDFDFCPQFLGKSSAKRKI